METISVRIEDIRGLDFFGRILKENRSKTLRTLVDEGKKAKAIDLYKKKKVSLGLGAKLAGVTISEFIDLLKKYNIRLNLELEDVKEALNTAERVL
ncbi:UPF0175 family protein [Candidatus Woesearchaeota archaeon]|nr:UPF0175 family protein [Candidatus Woesearchaeota archaeon]